MVHNHHPSCLGLGPALLLAELFSLSLGAQQILHYVDSELMLERAESISRK